MALLEVRELKKNFGETEVLKGISFDLNANEVLSIIGSSGSGKTTLLRCLNFLEHADHGCISVDGKRIYDAADPATRAPKAIHKNRTSFGLVFQSFNLFPQYSVLENLTLAAMLKAKESGEGKINKKELKEKLEQQGMELLTRIGLTDKKDAYPCMLSGGQQQRVAIARALMLTPRILCFDEPTSALDPELTKEVLHVIKDLRAAGNTMIVVTHEMEFAKNASDKVIFMSKGVIEESGTPEELFGSPKSPALRSFLMQ
ncbi:MAG: amino acid ABC transporter ATP-binding protein [Lachnospiraceae bacterium]|nr:amino acid ABC transporter ATP-binding protein [Lachnospiraceae bacterium]